LVQESVSRPNVEEISVNGGEEIPVRGKSITDPVIGLTIFLGNSTPNMVE